jgi:hypothetical protein
MDIDDEEFENRQEPTSSSSKGEKKRFEVKKVSSKDFLFISFDSLNNAILFFILQWNAVALWAWGKDNNLF